MIMLATAAGGMFWDAPVSDGVPLTTRVSETVVLTVVVTEMPVLEPVVVRVCCCPDAFETLLPDPFEKFTES